MNGIDRTAQSNHRRAEKLLSLARELQLPYSLPPGWNVLTPIKHIRHKLINTP